MFLLLSGASGVGQSTVRELIADQLEPGVRCAELAQLVAIPPLPDLAWRQRATEAAVQQALADQREGRHFLLAGDPVAFGELVAAPSADRLDSIAGCLLDCRPDAQLDRLRRRGDPPAALEAHLNFAAWMRGHARNPQHRPEVITAAGWGAMRWERWLTLRAGDPRWRFEEIDTTDRSPPETAAEVLAWCRQQVLSVSADYQR